MSGHIAHTYSSKQGWNKISKFYRKISGMSTWKPIVFTLIKCISKDLSLTKIVNFTDKDFVFAVF